MRAIILAAGEGSRLRPLTGARPKPMLRIANKPILQYVVEALVAGGVEDITMVVGYHREKVQTHFENGKRFGARIDYVFQESYLGTAHALAQVGFGTEDVLVLSGDNLVDVQVVKDLLGAAARFPGEVGLVAKASDNPSKYGVLTLEGDHVAAIEEKPPFYTSEFVNTGMYVFPAGFDEDLARLVKEGVFGLSFVLDDLIRSGRTIRAVRTRGMWMDVIYPWDLVKATSTLLAAQGLDIEKTGSESIHPTAVLEGPLVLGEACTVGPHAVLLGASSIGENTHVGPHAVLENVVVGNDVHIGPHAILRNAVIADGVRIGPRFTALSGACDVRVRDGYHEVDDFGCVLGEDVTIEGNVTTAPGALVGNRARVGSNTVLRGTIPDEGVVL